MIQATLSVFNTHEEYTRSKRTQTQYTYIHNNVKQCLGQTSIHLEREIPFDLRTNSWACAN